MAISVRRTAHDPANSYNGLTLVVLGDPESRIAALEAAGPGGSAIPVGGVFEAVVPTDPSTLLGYGTWQLIGTRNT